jgi:hypothetical protein
LQIVLIVGAISSLLIVGIFPQVFLPLLAGLVSGYTLTP